MPRFGLSLTIPRVDARLHNPTRSAIIVNRSAHIMPAARTKKDDSPLTPASDDGKDGKDTDNGKLKRK